ncbi:DUF6107 family protein [Albibacillus kandeliae]|uniref:DUF6107 family protein n=1 Tax=Albibacillus kandeliae TaxID=2174228 RepID=UPI000D694696|nr:DUF6107 family protein [Albibacillus kandeliae]
MNEYFGDEARWIARALGAALGVIASMIMVAPAGTKNAFYRLWIGIVMGAIFSPVVDDIWFFGGLAGEDFDHTLARSAVAGFSVWFVLEFTARMISSTDWLVELAKEVLRMNASGGRKG